MCPLIAGLLLLAGILISARTALAQSVAIHLVQTNQLSIDAVSEANLGYRIQASADFQNWQDISDQLSGAFSYRIDATNGSSQFFRLRAWSTEDAPITVILLGDSTVADFEADLSQFYGWGPGLPSYMKPNVRIVNYGTPLQSTRTFLYSLEKDNLLKVKPDFVLVTFGLMDTSDLPGYGTTLSEYEANLRTIIQMIRDFNGTPILVTPPVPRIFDGSGTTVPFLEDRRAVVLKLADELQTYVIDLNHAMADLYTSMGPAASSYITAGPLDWTHFTEAGSRVIAGLVVDRLPLILKAQVLDSSGNQAP